MPKRIIDFKKREVSVDGFPRLCILMDDIIAYHTLNDKGISDWLEKKRGKYHPWSMEQIRSIQAFVDYFFGGCEDKFFAEMDIIASNYQKRNRKITK